jgi:hypothetical protein
MPTIGELEGLYSPEDTAGTGFYTNGRYWPAKMHSVFDGIGGGSWVWSDRTEVNNEARSFNFNRGIGVTFDRNGESYSTRAFAVRHRID